MKSKCIFCLFALFVVSCCDVNAPEPERDFNISLRYGVLARNELNSFAGTFTKDLILEGTVTASFHLPAADLDSIEAKMEQISFFNYPDTFRVTSRDSIRSFIMPYSSYDFKVASRSRMKTLFWEDAIVANDPQATKLRELITLIKEIVESKPEYQQLPAARGGYL